MSETDQPKSTAHSADQPVAPSILTRCIATGFFSGYIPWASGLFGTLVGALFFLIPHFSHPLILGPAIVLACAVGVVTAGKIAEVEGHRLTASARRAKDLFQSGTHSSPDPSIVVIDEIVGMWIAMFTLYPSFAHPPIVAVLAAFAAFRVFDIIKPYPARQLERVGGGWGIMLDDVVAGIYANIASRLLVAVLFHFFPSLF
ncbi:MAG: hypothetical protein C4326_09230 [Ignavibacteria bacterium]